MKRWMLAVCVLLWPLAAQAQQEKLAQTGFKFASLSLDARAAGMGDAMTALEGGSEMLFYNPAGMARQGSFLDVNLGQVQWIADIGYNAAALSFRPAGGRFGVLGFSMIAVDYGSIKGTIRADNEQGFIDTGLIEPTAFSFGVGYAKALTDRFSVGGQVKYLSQDLGSSVTGFAESGDFMMQENQLGVIGYDFGVLYKTGFRSLAFAVSARNFAEEISYEEESFQIPLTMKIGVSMDLFDLTGGLRNQSFMLSVDAETPRDFSEQIKIGGEYLFFNTLALRAGYVFPTDEQGINLGLGVQQKLAGIGVGADYAYTDFGVFNNVHRVTLRLSL